MMVGTKAIATLSTAISTQLDYARRGCRARGHDADDHKERSPRHHRSTTPMSGVHCNPGASCAVSLHRGTSGRRCCGDCLRADADMAERVTIFCADREGAVFGAGLPSLTVSLQTSALRIPADYPIEQYIPVDAKFESLYEGTTAIQAQDFFFRKMRATRAERRRTWSARSRSPWQ